MTDVFGFVTLRGRYNKAVPCYAVYQEYFDLKCFCAIDDRWQTLFLLNTSDRSTVLIPGTPDPDGEGIGSGAATRCAVLRVGQDGPESWAQAPGMGMHHCSNNILLSHISSFDSLSCTR
jgi:hypothetical protein